MADRFDELAKALVSGVTRRDALKRLAVGLVGGLLAAAGFVGKSRSAAPGTCCRLTVEALGSTRVRAMPSASA